jgi:hypothetical protein
MAIKDMAFVDPKAVRSMADKTNHLKEELIGISKKLSGEMESLYKEGFKDAQFQDLKNRINQNQQEIQALNAFLDRYAKYLQDQAKRVDEYLNIKF